MTVRLILVVGGRVVARRRAMFVRHGTVAGSRGVLAPVAGRRTSEMVGFRWSVSDFEDFPSAVLKCI